MTDFAHSYILLFIQTRTRFKLAQSSTLLIGKLFTSTLFITWCIWLLKVHFGAFHDRIGNSHDEASVILAHADRGTAWFGPSAYPRVADKLETWRWITKFADSLPGDYAILDKILLNSLRDATSSLTVTSIRLAEMESSSLEGRLLEPVQSLRVHKRTVIRVAAYDCENNCRLLTDLRPEKPPAISGHVVFIHGLITHSYDIRRLVKAIRKDGTNKVLITAITTKNRHIKKGEENFALELYNLFHSLYFHHNWIPVAADHQDCTKSHRHRPQRRGCITWVAWIPLEGLEGMPLTYIPPAGNGSSESELQRLASFLNRPTEDVCRNMQKLGGTRQNVYIDFIDGQYAVCLDRLLPKMLPMSVSNSCLVYSFGVNDDWSFDNALHGRGCEVHSFDPSSGGASHKRGLRHWFHAWGLGTRTNALKPEWKMLTYAQIRQKLGHEGRPVDVLKLDIEGSEWSFLENTLMDHPSMLDAVNQLIMEIHPEGFEGMQARVIRQRSLLLHHLEKRGFTLFKSRVNVNGPNLRSFDFSKRLNETQGHFMYELSFIKI